MFIVAEGNPWPLPLITALDNCYMYLKKICCTKHLLLSWICWDSGKWRYELRNHVSLLLKKVHHHFEWLIKDYSMQILYDTVKFRKYFSKVHFGGLIFSGAYLRKEVCVSESISLIMEVNLAFLLCFTLYLRAIFQVQAPWGLIFGGAI